MKIAVDSYLNVFTYIHNIHKGSEKKFPQKKINKGKEVYSTRNKEEDYISREKFTLPLKNAGNGTGLGNQLSSKILKLFKHRQLTDVNLFLKWV